MSDDKLPLHIAIIPDGNRRWAKERGLQPWIGHEQGAKNIENLVRQAFDLGIKNMSFWGSSLNNITKRPLSEKKELLRIYEEYFQRLMESEDIFKNKARINVFGRWKEYFPASLVDIIEKGIDKTKDHLRYNLNFFLAYNGDDEMVEAVKKIVEMGLKKEEITGETIKSCLMTSDLPPVDYLIRTGGEPHLSVGFMMWDIANAELYFTDKYFPDFNSQQLKIAIDEYKLRGRKMGV